MNGLSCTLGGEGWRGDIQWARKNISRIICQRSEGRTFKERVVKGAGLLQEKLACTLRVRDKEMITELLSICTVLYTVAVASGYTCCHVYSLPFTGDTNTADGWYLGGYFAVVNGAFSQMMRMDSPVTCGIKSAWR
jgi:hypothetical protein